MSPDFQGASSLDAESVLGTYFIVVLHQLDNDPNVVAVVLYGYDPHNIRSILGVRVLTVFIS